MGGGGGGIISSSGLGDRIPERDLMRTRDFKLFGTVASAGQIGAP